MRPCSLIWLVLATPSWLFAANARTDSRVSKLGPLSVREREVARIPVRNSEYAAVPHAATHLSCEATKPPQALATPNPLLSSTDPNVKIKVSFIVGTDGRVHSPLILESAGTNDDRAVLETVRAWRYRPAMCNGVPTETEGKIEFSSR